ncbi:MltR family transcriptional regulator [Sandaracinobacter sp.]|uniref:MltR family transcriptional regulator n=1 Tax=Sandaracinobacter sp. TaxID=2487581 RepID=UPI0035B094CF
MPRDDHPHLAKFFPYLELLRAESDRGAVLISTGYMEEQLKDVLLAFMLDTPQARELVTSGNAPLGSFSSRISACYTLGLISENEYSDLMLLRRIRNDFAHDMHTSFDTPSVVDRCKLLHHKAHDYTSEKMGDVVVNTKGQFITAATSLVLNLTNRPHYVALKRCGYGNWPY